MGYISSEVNESYYMIGILVVGSILGMVQIISRGLWVALLVEMVVVEVPESSLRRIVILGPRRRIQYPCCYSIYDFTTLRQNTFANHTDYLVYAIQDVRKIIIWG